MSESLKREYEIGENIGHGRYGTVYRCTCRASGDAVAVKSIDKTLASGDYLEARSLINEPKILLLIPPHRNVTKLHSVYEDDVHLHMVTDLCQFGNLYDLIITNRCLPEIQARAIFKQLMAAISHCHRHSVVHRDIKPDNVLFDSRDSIKLADFGSAEVAIEGESLSGVVGTPYYIAPEVLMGGGYREKIDVWCAGVVLYVMLSGVPPFHGESTKDIFEKVIRGNLRFPPDIFRNVSSDAKDLLRKMICKDASRRLSAADVLRHPWITAEGLASRTGVE